MIDLSPGFSAVAAASRYVSHRAGVCLARARAALLTIRALPDSAPSTNRRALLQPTSRTASSLIRPRSTAVATEVR